MSEPTIGVMLTAYKRTHLLMNQMRAIEAQTVKPKRIMVWDNSGHHTWKSPDVTSIAANDNLGVWPRFMLSPILGTDYIAVFDDDTIPGPRWFENCLKTLETLEAEGINGALLGGVGVSFIDGERENRCYLGWKHPADVAIQTDIVGHAWFYAPCLINDLLSSLYSAKYPTCGEDYSLAFAAQRLGFPTVCPPHPEHDQSWWGSIGGMENGSDDVALWRDPAECAKKAEFHRLIQDAGMKFESVKHGDEGLLLNAWEMPFLREQAKVCPTCGQTVGASC